MMKKRAKLMPLWRHRRSQNTRAFALADEVMAAVDALMRISSRAAGEYGSHAAGGRFAKRSRRARVSTSLLLLRRGEATGKWMAEESGEGIQAPDAHRGHATIEAYLGTSRTPSLRANLFRALLWPGCESGGVRSL